MPPDNPARPWRKILQLGGYALAIGLLAASIWYALQGQQLADWWHLLKDSPLLTAALFVAVAGSSIIVPAIQFWFVTRPFVTKRPLQFDGMLALTAGGALLNYTPFKAGLIGRITYLKHYHGVGLRAALFTSILITAIFIASSALTVALIVWRGGFDSVFWISTLVGLTGLALLSVPVLRLTLPASMITDPVLRGSTRDLLGYLGPCYALQLVGLNVTALRWWLVFQIMERPIPLADAWLAAIVHMVSIAAGPANGVGLREWLIALGGELGGISADADLDMSISIAAALIDRSVEALVLIGLGLLGLAYLRRKTSAANRESGAPISSADVSGPL